MGEGDEGEEGENLKRGWVMLLQSVDSRGKAIAPF